MISRVTSLLVDFPNEIFNPILEGIHATFQLVLNIMWCASFILLLKPKVLYTRRAIFQSFV